MKALPSFVECSFWITIHKSSVNPSQPVEYVPRTKQAATNMGAYKNSGIDTGECVTESMATAVTSPSNDGEQKQPSSTDVSQPSSLGTYLQAIEEPGT
jgi:hypothetical protein